jgi:FtsP/CotA-like multicopper oxidase with cupredoxin domain
MRRSRSRLAALALAAASLAVPAAVAVAGPAAPDVPGDIAVEAGHKPYLAAHAEGVQIYTCLATAGGHAWSPATPRADLFGANGKRIGRHYGGPTWEARDGSKVVAARVRGVTVDPTAIPWLLLSASSTSAGGDGDRFEGTTFIQRVGTVGGLAPAAGECTAGTVGTVREIPYEAEYVFYKQTGA